MNYLIAGVAGTGKTTIAETLQNKGFEALDADISEYSHWVERANGNPYTSRPDAKDWVGKFDWLWKEEKMRELLEKERTNDLFVCGTSNNLSVFLPKFKRIFVLTASPEVITHRLQTRTNNPFGKREGDIEQTLSWKIEFESEMQDQEAVFIDTEAPANQVVDTILGYINEAS